MTKIYFVCGFIGSGKTTYSKALAEKHGAFRFSIDEWMIPLYGEHMEREVFDSRLATLQGLFKDSAMQLFSLGVPVIFDFGFWRKNVEVSGITETSFYQSKWYQGIGIRMLSDGWLYNTSIGSALKLSLSNGKHVYIGCKDTDGLKLALKTANEQITQK
ncbi:AAA family ATPase [Vibrio splendidus]|uniref:AAA family ATPase n=1 Tax=Vibrio splendidus TaxID=29497 RepID=A0ABD5A6B0_VIBSP|nr:AAA family ATPase [Vibrio splendidus]MDP2488483.1 AAA family ATPase [Vibrio splendidus]PMO57620.1 hypothetical protein BCT08_03530 [Vibrio splendidus]